MDGGADFVLVVWVFWVDRDGSVAKESFWSSSRNDNIIIGNVPKCAFFVFMFHFDVSKGGLVLRAEVDELFASINKAVVPHFFKGGVDTINDVFV